VGAVLSLVAEGSLIALPALLSIKVADATIVLGETAITWERSYLDPGVGGRNSLRW